jgi:hypothetical protein
MPVECYENDDEEKHGEDPAGFVKNGSHLDIVTSQPVEFGELDKIEMMSRTLVRLVTREHG